MALSAATILSRRRDTKTVCDLGDADVGIGQQCPRGFKVVLCQLWWTAPRSACAPSGGKAGLGVLADQAALEFRRRAEHVKDQSPCAVVVSRAAVRLRNLTP